jgi:hypothetical protein
LPLSPAQVAGVCPPERIDIQRIHKSPDVIVPLSAYGAQSEIDVLLHRKPRKQGIPLLYESHASPSVGTEMKRSAGGGDESRKTVQQRCLSAARGTDNGTRFAGSNGQGDVVNSAPAGIRDGKVVDPDHRLPDQSST